MCCVGVIAGYVQTRGRVPGSAVAPQSPALVGLVSQQLQPTGINKEAGLLRLTTVLAHLSGEWISSEWPVCQIADASSTQRMGAALTYGNMSSKTVLIVRRLAEMKHARAEST